MPAGGSLASHGALRRLCAEAIKPQLVPKYIPHAPPGGFGTEIQAFAQGTLELQEKRHSADYDPSIRFNTSDAVLVIDVARTALAQFDSASAESREAFLGLLLFQPR